MLSFIKDGSYQKLRDIEGQTVYVMSSESKMYKEAKERLLTKIEVEYSEEADNSSVGAHLLDGSQKSDEIIFVSNTNYELLCENNDKFEETTKILYSIPITVKSDDFAKRINVTEDPFNVYITGMVCGEASIRSQEVTSIGDDCKSADEDYPADIDT